jgi:hypothetical protein
MTCNEWKDGMKNDSPQCDQSTLPRHHKGENREVRQESQAARPHHLDGKCSARQRHSNTPSRGQGLGSDADMRRNRARKANSEWRLDERAKKNSRGHRKQP